MEELYNTTDAASAANAESEADIDFSGLFDLEEIFARKLNALPLNLYKNITVR